MKKIILLLCFLIPLNSYAQPLIEKAVQHYIDKDWKAAMQAYENITADNPYHGAYWYRLGYASLQNKEFDQSIKASHKAIELGVAVTSAMYNIGSCYALKGEKGKATVQCEF